MKIDINKLNNAFWMDLSKINIHADIDYMKDDYGKTFERLTMIASYYGKDELKKVLLHVQPNTTIDDTKYTEEQYRKAVILAIMDRYKTPKKNNDQIWTMLLFNLYGTMGVENFIDYVFKTGNLKEKTEWIRIGRVHRLCFDMGGQWKDGICVSR